MRTTPGSRGAAAAWALIGLAALWLGGCTYDDGKPDSHPPSELDPQGCAVPEPPTITTPEVVVGDGTAMSCTAQALRTALESPARVHFDCGSDPVTIAVDTPLVLHDGTVIHRCEFRENEVTDPGLGGAIRIDAEAYVSQSLFVDNTNAGQGGALWMGRGPALFDNVTFYGNHADLWGGALSYGDKSIRLRNCTVARNTAGEAADALFGDAGALVAHNTLFVDNGDSPSSRRHCSASIGGSRNLAYPAEPDDTSGQDLIHADPRVAADLADLGGATQTLALEDGSAAIDAGADCPATDQRGEPRNASVCDLGAFER